MKSQEKDLSRQGAIEDQFGKRVANLLNAHSKHLDPSISEKLSQARVFAVDRAKPEALPIFNQQLASAHTNFKAPRSNHPLWSFSSWLIPLAVVVLGLIAITEWQEDQRIKDIATVDIALLTDDVPPDAFVDNGFMAFLKLKTVAKPEAEEKKTEDEKI